MRKIILLSFVFIAINSASFAQSNCKYNGSESAIVSELSKRNTNTGKHKLNQEELKKIAGYWVADCKCKKGVATRGEAEKLYQDAFLRREISAYQDGQNYKKDLSVFGDLQPPFTVFTISSCLKGNNSTAGMSLESGTDCAPEASRLSELDGQLSAYAAQFFVAYCQCKNGVPSKEYADQLVATMKSTHKSFNDFKNAATARLSTQPLTSCKIVEDNEVRNNVYEQPLEKLIFNAVANAERGKFLANTLRQRLEHYKTLENTLDPSLLLSDFNEKMTQIDRLSTSFTEEQWLMGIDGADQIINTIKGDGAQGVEALGTLYGFFEMSKAKKELKQQKEALYEQRRVHMSNIFWHAIDRVDEEIERYQTLAAYSQDQEMEEYYLKLIRNLECYKDKMDINWTPEDYIWLINDCKKPLKPTTKIENKFIAKDLQYFEIAKKKYKYYQERRKKYEGFGGAIKSVDMNRDEDFIDLIMGGGPRVFENIVKDSPLYKAGFRNGDQVLTIGRPYPDIQKIAIQKSTKTGSRIQVSIYEKLKYLLSDYSGVADKETFSNILMIIENGDSLSMGIQKYIDRHYYSHILLHDFFTLNFREKQDLVNHLNNHDLLVNQKISREQKLETINLFYEDYLDKIDNSSFITEEQKIWENKVIYSIKTEWDEKVDDRSLSLEHLSYALAMRFPFDKETLEYLADYYDDMLQLDIQSRSSRIDNYIFDTDFKLDNLNYNLLMIENYDGTDIVIHKKTIIEGPLQFRESAISFIAAAIDINPKPEYYYTLGVYYEEINSIVAYSNLLYAKSLDERYFDEAQTKKLKEIENEMIKKMSDAISFNDQDYVISFLKSGLYNEIDFNGHDLLSFALFHDQPDVVQLIMNKMIENKTQKEIDILLKKAILKSAYANSFLTFNMFLKMGVSIEFTLEGDTPRSVAEKYNSKAVLKIIED